MDFTKKSKAASDIRGILRKLPTPNDANDVLTVVVFCLSDDIGLTPQQTIADITTNVLSVVRTRAKEEKKIKKKKKA